MHDAFHTDTRKRKTPTKAASSKDDISLEQETHDEIMRDFYEKLCKAKTKTDKEQIMKKSKAYHANYVESQKAKERGSKKRTYESFLEAVAGDDDEEDKRPPSVRAKGTASTTNPSARHAQHREGKHDNLSKFRAVFISDIGCMMCCKDIHRHHAYIVHS